MSYSLNITVLVGNGFDLSAGLETSTTRFMSTFAEARSDDDGPVGRLARRVIEDKPDKWADFEKKLGEYTSELESSEEDCVSAALDCKEAIDDALFKFIASEDERITQEFIKANSTEVFESLAGWFDSLQPREQAALTGDYSLPYSLDVRFVTFNYTSLLPRLYKEYGEDKHPIASGTEHITELRLTGLTQAHSSLDRDLVCGVNDVSQIASKALAADTNVATTFVKGEIQKAFGSIDDSQAVDAINSAHILIIFGLSLGETDARWWTKVVNFLKASSSRRVIIASTQATRTHRSIVKLQRFSTDLKKKLLLQGGANEGELRALSSRIYIIPSSSILRFKETLPKQ